MKISININTAPVVITDSIEHSLITLIPVNMTNVLGHLNQILTDKWINEQLSLQTKVYKQLIKLVSFMPHWLLH